MTLLVILLVNAYAEFGVHPARDVVEAELEQEPGTARAGSPVRLSTTAELPRFVWFNSILQYYAENHAVLKNEIRNLIPNSHFGLHCG